MSASSSSYSSSSIIRSIKNYFTNNNTTNKRKILYYIIGLFLFFHFVKFSIRSLAPAGYTKQKCMTPIREIRKSENLLAIFTKVAKQHNFVWWLDHGALLGTIRNGHMLPFDKDIDANFFEADLSSFFALEPHLQKYGIRRFGVTLVWEEDIFKMEHGESEEVSAKLEFYTLLQNDEIVFRPDIIEYVTATSFLDRVWWVLLRYTGVGFHPIDDLLPTSTATMRRYIPKDKKVMKKLIEEEKKNELENPKFRKDKNNLRPFEVDEEDDEALNNWKLAVPVPRYPELTLERLYGKSWTKEIPWKVTCYV